MENYKGFLWDTFWFQLKNFPVTGPHMEKRQKQKASNFRTFLCDIQELFLQVDSPSYGPCFFI